MKATCFPFIGDFLALLTSCTCKQKCFFVIILLFCRNMYDASLANSEYDSTAATKCPSCLHVTLK